MRSFVAIDFETANEQRRSACAVGLVRFDSDGAVVDTYYSLIRPHPEVDYFNPVNTWVHGLTERDVEDAPAWDQIAGRVHDFVGADPIVAHNMAFDGYVLSDLANLYNTRPIDNRRFCTLRLARSILATELERKKLSHVYDYYFPGETFEHHNATADAEACGRIFARMQRDHSYEKLEEICPATPASRATRR
ncbi:exonuclease domain-containing protein [Tessaracoccus sp. OH4464_COT-324]|uniref:exonuclease domain-containing protein n=1 Tax=Tessaracoccus sp. OH4464_COT-324 TaxID=2491059 RepID=UPI0018F64192|nr:exonuclease domain-containing protein [Tessaracoccus sp. OH4464_COT-324]